MCRLAKQAVEHQRQGIGEGVGGRSSKLVRPHCLVQTGKVDNPGLERDIRIQAGWLRVGFTDRQIYCRLVQQIHKPQGRIRSK